MFKITNSSETLVTNNVSYYQLPLFRREVALQVGDYKISVRTADINGWLVCDGRSLLIADYPELYNVIGTSFGSVDEDHFNIPDYTSCALGMFGTSANTRGLTTRTIGTFVGTETTTLSVGNLPAHSHTGTTDAGGVHSHSHNANGGAGTSGNPATGLSYSNGSNTAISLDSTNGELNLTTTPIALSINNSSSHTHTFTSNNTGNNQSFSQMQPTLFGCQVLIFSSFGDFHELTPM